MHTDATGASCACACVVVRHISLEAATLISVMTTLTRAQDANDRRQRDDQSNTRIPGGVSELIIALVWVFLFFLCGRICHCLKGRAFAAKANADAPIATTCEREASNGDAANTVHAMHMPVVTTLTMQIMDSAPAPPILRHLSWSWW